jgi:hypothetical protein
MTHPEMQALIGNLPPFQKYLDRELAALPERSDRVLVGIMAKVSLAQHEGDSVGADEGARRVGGHGHDLAQGPRGGEPPDDRRQRVGFAALAVYQRERRNRRGAFRDGRVGCSNFSQAIR